MEKAQLLEELKKKFEEIKNEFKFKANFEEINDIFFIEDFILKEGFVSNQFERQISGRITETFNRWAGYLHNFVLPNPGNVVSMTENKLFNEEEKKKIWVIFKMCMDFSSRNSLGGLTRDKKYQANFVDNSVEFWNNSLKPKLLEIMNKVNSEWGK